MVGGTYVGCVVDTDTSTAARGRLLDGPFFARVDGLTQEGCLALCSTKTDTTPNAPYKYFAIEFGRDCRCGNAYRYTPPIDAPATECNVTCTPNQACGGMNRMSLFTNDAAAAVSLNSLSVLAQMLYALQKIPPSFLLG